MMTLKKLSLLLALLLGLASLAPAFALAQTTLGAGVDASANATVGSTSVSAGARFTATETRAKTRGGNEIDRRITALTDLNTRVQAMQRVSDAFKQSLGSTVQAEISTLTTLKTKIDGDNDSATLKTDLQSITDGYRIYVLVLPQGRIAAAADRVATIVNMMGTLGGKLHTRIQAAAAAGNDVTALNSTLSDLSAKITDAQTQAQAAITASATLQLDNGDKTVMASNTAALKQARADIVAAQKDLADARKDIGTIISGLAKFPGANAGVNASSTTNTTTQ